MKRCKKCILNENFPGIEFDEDGVCNFCREEQESEVSDLANEYEDKFLNLIDRFKGKNTYDCIAAFSGGKDSSYTLYLLKEKYKLNILAFNYDNWYQSKFAQKNIKQIVKKLDIDLINFLPLANVYKKILKTVINNNFYSLKSIQRASDICTTCISIIRFACLKIALEKEIPFVIFGMSPGQSPISTSIFKTNPLILKSMQGIVLKPLREKLGSQVDSFFLTEKYFNQSFYPYIINPLSFSSYNKNKIYAIIKKFGWQEPDDTDPNSTNCLLNSLANQIHIDKYGFNPYAYELSTLIRKGYMTRQEALERIQKGQSNNLVDKLRADLNMLKESVTNQ